MKLENIKFKAKRLDNGEWIYGSLIRSTAGIKERAYIVDYFRSMSDYKVIGVDPSTVCQFTGLKDCEGNEVWEGDILEGESKSEIVYAKGTFANSLIGYNKRVFSYPLCYYIKEDEMVDGKVVGNNFDKKK